MLLMCCNVSEMVKFRKIFLILINSYSDHHIQKSYGYKVEFLPFEHLVIIIGTWWMKSQVAYVEIGWAHAKPCYFHDGTSG